MFTESEIRILEILNKKLLARLNELKQDVGEPDGVNAAIQRLLSMDCVKIIEPMGEKCYVITWKGAKGLRKVKSPEKRLGQEASFNQGYASGTVNF